MISINYSATKLEPIYIVEIREMFSERECINIVSSVYRTAKKNPKPPNNLT